MEEKKTNALEMAAKAHEKRKAKAAEEIMIPMTEAPLAKELYDILACPVCKGDIEYTKNKTGLLCKKCKIEYPIKEGIPIMLPPDFG